METNYPSLKRPKRKLCYPTKSPSKQWAGELLLEDVSKMFDDLDSASHDDCDMIPPSLLLDTENKQGWGDAAAVPQEGPITEKPPTCEMVPKENDLHPASRSASPKLDIDLDIPFKGHGPVKTSSPIERDTGAEEQDNEKDQAVSPILFFCEDKEQEKAKKEALPIQKPPCNGLSTEESDDFNLDSPPSKIFLSKSKSSLKNKVEASCKESQPVDEKIPKKSQIPVFEGKRKTERQENADPPVSAVRQQPEQPAPEKSVRKEPAVETSTRVGKEMTVFLQRLRDAGQHKPANSRKSLSPVKVPTCPPEPEDDFLILEDDTPIRFSILSKTAAKKRQKQSKTSSTDRDSSTDKGVKDVSVPLETTQKQQELDQAENRKLQSKTVNQKVKKKGKEREKEVTETENDMDGCTRSTPEDLPAVDLVDQDKPNKKTQKQRLTKESEKAEDKPKDTTSRETDEENSSKPQRSSELKRSKSTKYKKENAKTSKAKSLKVTRKEMKGSDGVKEPRSSEQDADVEDLGSLSDKELLKPEAQTANIKTKQNKQSALSVESSSDDGQVLGKRKRNPPGQWWLSCPDNTEETKVTDNQPVLKRSKQNHKELGAEVSSPVKAKNEGLLKQRCHNTNKKKNKHRTTREDNPDKMKETAKEPHMISSEQIDDQDQQQDALDQDPVLVFPHREHSFNSGDQIFQKVYHHSSSEKMSNTPAAPVSPSRPSEQLGTSEQGKRKRKPPGAWWRVDNTSEDMESISSQSQQLNRKEPKPHKERKTKQNKNRSPELGTPRKGNAAVSSNPPGGAHVTSLKRRQAPGTIRRTLATFKDIFSSAAESNAVLNNRDAGQNNSRDVTVCPAEDSATDGTTLSKTNKEILSIDVGESNHDSPPLARRRHSTSTAFRSGPSSMIELEQYEENDDMVLPSNRIDHSTLSVLDLCAPPLKPLVLQAKDKVNLAEWLKSLWPATVNNGAEITPDHFDWYFYQGRAIGFLQDLQSGSISNGKILLGSHMKKPLWVDHSATTVFNVLTSSVSVTVDCNETRFNPGQSFMAECGHAYSIQNLTAQPAVLCFTRILEESPD